MEPGDNPLDKQGYVGYAAAILGNIEECHEKAPPWRIIYHGFIKKWVNGIPACIIVIDKEKGQKNHYHNQ